MHVPSGLFVQGHYQGADFGAPAHIASGYWGSAGGPTKEDATQWLIQGGISKNWFGLGNTALYSEYGKALDWGAESAGRPFAGNTSTLTCIEGTIGGTPNATCTSTLLNFTPVNGVIDTEMTIWGLGITQNVDAAASQLYLGYRNFQADITCTGAPTAAGAGVGPPGGTAKSLPTEDIHVVVGGAIVRF